MKKLFSLLTAIVLMTSFVSANNDYKINDATIDNLFANAEEVSVVSSDFDLLSIAAPTPEITKSGYLLRAFFCGAFGLHRSYMGTGGKTLWYMYFCIPVAGGVVACVDFWGVVFKGDEFMNKYKDNGKWIVWMD